ncbi:uncharacterized protein LOC125499809 [Athalia rosae]|uniref:uncharacterized protein LOC125499809 n=1 Tax=Athalia rosae TaxID=37344 RepID=UPI002034957D|nr:uncharacterized protein LOC125499809 [Athalia rosae]
MRAGLQRVRDRRYLRYSLDSSLIGAENLLRTLELLESLEGERRRRRCFVGVCTALRGSVHLTGAGSGNLFGSPSNDQTHRRSSLGNRSDPELQDIPIYQLHIM